MTTPYSLSTVYMTILTSNLLLVLIALFFRSSKVMINLGYRLLAVFVVVTFLRYLFPFELPFVQTIFLPKYISLFIVFFRHPFFYVGNYGVCIWNFLEIIWVIGIIDSCIRYVRKNQIFHRYILLMGKKPQNIALYMKLLDSICQSRQKKNVFRILEIDGITSPQIYGLKKPCILLPANLNLSEDDMYFVLSHEASHHFHHDLWLKHLVCLLSIVYWWNPACHYLYEKASLLLEMRVDDFIVRTPKETGDYLNCLLSLAEKAHTNRKQAPDNALSLSFAQYGRGELTQRFEMLVNRDASHNLVLNIFVFFIVFLLYFASYFFTFEASYSPQEIEETISITDDTSYFIQNEDGSYDLYYTGIYFETITSLDYFSNDIPVYTMEEYNSLTGK